MTKKVEHEFRCMSCNKLLFKFKLNQGVVEIMCPDSRCKALNRLEVNEDGLAREWLNP